MEDLIKTIKSRGFWKVVIRPAMFNKQIIASLSECITIIEEAKVSLRGWDYPHYGNKGRLNGLDWIESQVDFGVHKELFRFYQSGQFIHYFAIREDWMMEDPWYGDKYKHIKPLSILGVISTLYTNTEIFEFASRLAEKNILGKDIYLSIELHRNKERSLVSLDFDRYLSEGYISTLDIIPYEKQYLAEELLGKSSELSLDYTIWLFEKFQWMKPSRDVLREAQKKLLEKRL